MLTAAERELFRAHGYLWLREFFTDAETRDLRTWTDELAAWPETPGRWMRYYERNAADPSAKLLARVENFVPYHTGLASLFASRKVSDVLAECCGEPVLLFKDKINFKYPGGAAFTPHQDYPAYVNFGVAHHVTLMAPVDPFTRENGCLVMTLDASERRILPQNPDGTVQQAVLDRLESTPVLAAPGDVIVFDAWVPHWSGRNESSAPRRSYYLTFNPTSAGDHRAAYYARKRECFPPEYERRPGVDYARLGAQFNLANPFD